MYRNAKYIIWDDGITECVAIFSSHLKHQEMAFRLGVDPISAGFVTWENKEPQVFGESTSLKLKSRPEDNLIIKRTL